MALGFGPRSTTADFVPYVRYNAMGVHCGIWSDRDHDDIAFVALSDLEHIKTGWLLFETGLPPDLHWDASLGQPGPRPGKGHKRGLCLRLFFPEAGIGLRELTTNNAGVCAAIDKIYSEFEFAPERAQGLVPLVECISSETSFGAIFDPVLAIIGWRPRPPRPREAIERDITIALQAIEIAEQDLDEAQEELAELEAELTALPPEGIDEDLWYARHDPRQLDLLKPSKT
jgi:hypothetical protein